jgi:hypothetical protein
MENSATSELTLGPDIRPVSSVDGERGSGTLIVVQRLFFIVEYDRVTKMIAMATRTMTTLPTVAPENR